VELGVDAPELSRPSFVAGLDLDLAHRERRRRRPDRPKALSPRLRLLQELDVDLHVEDLHQAADVRAPELLVRIGEGTAALEAGAGVHDLVAMSLAAAAFDLVLRPERELARRDRRLLAYLHS